MPTSSTAPSRIGATVLGYPRIGRRRELKRALEAYWAGRSQVAELDAVATEVRADTWRTLGAASLTSVPSNTFSLYDQVLDTAVLLGVETARHDGVTGSERIQGVDVTHYFALARGTADEPPLEMTKWFDTNYHYLVPEIGPGTTFSLDASKPLAEHAEAVAAGLDSRPVVVGPWTFLAGAKESDNAPDGFDPLSRLDGLVPVYVELLGELARGGATWVQLDEPALVRDLTDEQVARVRDVYAALAAAPERPAIFVATYFGNPVEALPALATTDIEAIGLDLVAGVDVNRVRGLDGIAGKTLVLGAVDGHNIWRADLRSVLTELEKWKGVAADLAVSSSCSLLHVPHDTSVETALDPTLRANLAFADQKLAEVVALQAALDGASGDTAAVAFTASDMALAQRESIPGLHRPEVAAKLAAVTPADREREPRPERAAAQATRLDLPPLPTTTIGSFPQTSEIRRARAAHKRGELSESAYTEAMHREIRTVIALQEDLGLDVLVHGEAERNDMVQYFAEQLDGYVATTHGWVQSYGSRCVRPPILYGDVARRGPMTVPWTTFAQEQTTHPVKGMLTGPVTMLAWSFVREDQPRSVTADQVALALRDEVTDLEAAGIALVQVDEPALRETLPLRRADQAAYLDWAVGAFRLATSGVRKDTQIHTHLCYSEFGEIITAIDGLGADVTSIEAARSRMELLADVRERGFGGALGPGVYDIHSPRVPSQDEVTDLLRRALESLPAEKLWVNPDCGLKTRGYAEVTPSLEALVGAARTVRAELAP